MIMRLLYLTMFTLITTIGFSQNSPVLTKITADWCGNCGTWGWDYMEGMRDEFADNSALVLAVHYSGGLKNDTGEWWKNNLKSSGQPRFYLNNEVISVGRSNWPEELGPTKESADELINITTGVGMEYNKVDLNSGFLEVDIKITDLPAATNELFLANYVYEDHVESFQSQQGDNALHPNLLRSTMGPDFQGMSISDAGIYSFNMTLNPEWIENNLGLLTVVWEKNGDQYTMIHTGSIERINLSLDTEELLNSADFTFADRGNNFVISSITSDEYQLSLTDMNGRAITNTTFRNEVAINTSDFVSGIYVATLRSEKGVLSKQVFIK